MLFDSIHTTNGFEVFANPYGYYDGEPSHLCRFIDGGEVYMCGWDTKRKEPVIPHSHGVIKQAKEKGYRLPLLT